MVDEQRTLDELDPTELTANIPLTRICGQRDEAMRLVTEAADLLTRGHALADRARAMAGEAANGASFHLVDRSQDAAFRRLFDSFDAERSVSVFRQQADAAIWIHLLRMTGMERLMDATAREQFIQQLSGDVPEVNEGNVSATLESLRGDAKLMFQRGLARTFSDLDRRFKSHDAFRFESRIVLTRVFSEDGYWNHYSTTRAQLMDVERALAVLDGAAPMPGELEAAISASRDGSRLGRAMGHHSGPRQGVAETRYLRIKTFKNGNAHLWFTRKDLVEKANRVLADFYGEVLPDGVPRGEDVLRSRSGLPAKDLSFYRTPDAVVAELLSDLSLPDGARVLEPSCGDGAIIHGLVMMATRWQRDWTIEGVEIDPARIRAMPWALGRGVRILNANFLNLTKMPVYDAVLMNPPFYGTHWMEHVLHAFDFLKPGGILRAVLPVTAVLGESERHQTFRAWASKHRRWHHSNDDIDFKDLPAESFASSGTRVNTGILTLWKPKT